jgi:hypothetical protein
MELPTVNEPLDIKSRIKNVRRSICSENNDADCDRVAVWSFNDLPKYLWTAWSQELKEYGYTWQKFLKVLKLSTGDIVLWAIKDSITWNSLIDRIKYLLVTYKGEK